MSSNCCLRTLLTLLHALTGLGAGFFGLYSLISWNGDTTCIPALVDQSGYQVPFTNELLVACDIIVYGMVGVCLFNLANCLMINCLWHNACIAFLNLLMTVIYIAISLMGGTALLVYYFIWCDSLERKFAGSHGCQDAALRYDSYNSTNQMSQYKTRMEVQMASILVMCPLIAIAILTYSLTMRIFAKPDARDRQSSYIILHDETTPLLRYEGTVANNRTHSVSLQNVPNATSGTTNPFDE